MSFRKMLILSSLIGMATAAAWSSRVGHVLVQMADYLLEPFVRSAAAIVAIALPRLRDFTAPLTAPYAGAPYELRHEAGRSRIAADRGI